MVHLKANTKRAHIAFHIATAARAYIHARHAETSCKHLDHVRPAKCKFRTRTNMRCTVHIDRPASTVPFVARRSLTLQIRAFAHTRPPYTCWHYIWGKMRKKRQRGQCANGIRCNLLCWIADAKTRETKWTKKKNDFIYFNIVLCRRSSTFAWYILVVSYGSKNRFIFSMHLNTERWTGNANVNQCRI